MELGANSIDRLEIVTLSLEELNLKIPLVELAQIDGIGGLVDFLHDKLESEERATGVR